MSDKIFVNRILNMKKIKLIGLDMDHTLIRYKSKNFETLVYKLVIDNLINKRNYPSDIKKFKFNFNDAIRGLVIDSKNGNILKLSRFGIIRQSRHGTKENKYSEQKKFYSSIYVDLNDPNYMAIDTAFSIALCVLYSQLVDYKDLHPNSLPSYNVIANDVLTSVDEVHAYGDLKSTVSQNLEKFAIRDKHLVEGLKRFARHGKKLFILTNSSYTYAKTLLDYSIQPFLNKGEHWQDLFEYVITFANKPRFFYDDNRFLSIDPTNGTMSNINCGVLPGIYQGGNARKFTNDLNLKGDDILYIGDHIYGDILRLKKDCNWRTALVVEELGNEIATQKKIKPIEDEIAIHMHKKIQIERKYIKLHTKAVEEDTDIYHHQLLALQDKIINIDKTITKLIRSQQTAFNPKWGPVFRTGAEESYFAYQVDRFACIYMEKLSDLFQQSPFAYFRASRRLLAHEMIE